MSENRESCDCRRIPVPVMAGGITQPGDFVWDFDAPELGGKREDSHHFLYLQLPGEHRLGCIQVQRGAPGGERVWGWDGNEEKPTLTPSIWHKEIWHGHLTAGRLVSC